jgi:hypothetical protein
MQIIGGVRQTAPAWREVSFAPVFHGVHGGCTIPSPRGEISSAWRREGQTVQVELQLPRGVVAKVTLPGRKPERVTGRRAWTIPAQEVLSRRPAA